jgi:serine/threonine protein kinase
MGTVFEGRHLMLDRRAAVKLIRADLRDSHEARTRLAREARALARIDHPNVVRIFDMGFTERDVFLAMELLAGGTLREWMQVPRDWREVLRMFGVVGGGLAAVHEHGFVHRDVNPANVFLAADGTPKLGDFGLVATECGPSRGFGLHVSPFDRSVTGAGAVLGTLGYMAPEQQRGERVDARADQFAFCATLHEALVGELPDAGMLGPMPARLRAVLARGLAPKPAARFPTMRALLAALGE